MTIETNLFIAVTFLAVGLLLGGAVGLLVGSGLRTRSAPPPQLLDWYRVLTAYTRLRILAYLDYTDARTLPVGLRMILEQIDRYAGRDESQETVDAATVESFTNSFRKPPPPRKTREERRRWA